MPDPTSRIRFDSVPLKKALHGHIVHNRPGSDLDGLVRVWPNTSGPEASLCAGIIGPVSARTPPARYQLPSFRLGCVLPQTARVTLCNISPDPIWFWLSVCQVWVKRIRSGSKPQVQESPGPFLANANRIWSVHWDSAICLAAGVAGWDPMGNMQGWRRQKVNQPFN